MQLFFEQALRRVGAELERAILATVEPHIERFAAPGSGAEATKLDAPPADGDGGGPRLIASLKAAVEAALESTRPELDATSATAAIRTSKHTEREFRRLIVSVVGDVGLKLLETEPDLRSKIAAWRKINAARIVSLAKDKVDRVEQLLENKAGLRVEALRDEIQTSVGATKRQAALIARDQVLKLNGQIVEARHVAVGIEEYIWTCAGDKRVRGRPGGLYPDARPSHWELDGKRFRWDRPPVSAPHGQRGHPGASFQCRCTAYPILHELEGLK